MDYTLNIGKRVKKITGKPFKSTFKVNTVKGIKTHPTLNILCYTFEEDDSYVSVQGCCLEHETIQNRRITKMNRTAKTISTSKIVNAIDLFQSKINEEIKSIDVKENYIITTTNEREYRVSLAENKVRRIYPDSY